MEMSRVFCCCMYVGRNDLRIWETRKEKREIAMFKRSGGKNRFSQKRRADKNLNPAWIDSLPVYDKVGQIIRIFIVIVGYYENDDNE